MNDRLLGLLRRYWNFDDFRDPQRPVIEALLQGRDVLAVLPTGFGKSLIYQVAGLATGKLTVVISPLVALMEDQKDALMRRGILAEAFTGRIGRNELRRRLDNLRYGNYRFLFLSPERLQQAGIRNYLPYLDIGLWTVDEAHCVSEWGHDFRPEYLKIASFREHFPGVPFLALTATAIPRTREDIKRQLQLKDPLEIVRSFYRPNIAYRAFLSEDKYRLLLASLSPGQSAVVYVNTRKKTIDIARYLQTHGVPAAAFHGGLSLDEKNRRLHEWLSGKTPVMVATTAFGMGIDKADVRHVIHWDLPWSPEQYIQESGRAGRDGLPARATLLADATDRRKYFELLQLQMPEVSFIRNVYVRLMGLAGIAPGEGEGLEMELDPAQTAKHWQVPVYSLYTALQVLEKYGLIALDEESARLSRVQILSDPATVHRVITQDADQSLHWKVLAYLVRSTVDIFDFPVSFSEAKWAYKWEMKRRDVVRALQMLDRLGWVTYTPGSDRLTVRLTMPRDDDYIRMHQKAILHHFRIKQQKAQAMWDFADTRMCRVRFLKNYLGEQTAENFRCGNCDNCIRRQTHEDHEDIADQVIRLLRHWGEMSLPALADYFPDTEKLLKTLDALMDNRVVAMNARRNYFLKKPE